MKGDAASKQHSPRLVDMWANELRLVRFRANGTRRARYRCSGITAEENAESGIAQGARQGTARPRPEGLNQAKPYQDKKFYISAGCTPDDYCRPSPDPKLASWQGGDDGSIRISALVRSGIRQRYGCGIEDCHLLPPSLGSYRQSPRGGIVHSGR